MPIDVHDRGPEPHSTLTVRARSEYLEMPGLSLTMPQAARLFALEQDVCLALLDGLVDEGFLQRAGPRYTRFGSGRRSL